MTKQILWLAAVIFLAGCVQEEPGEKIVDGNKLLEKDGLVYELTLEKPFTGTSVWNFPNGKRQEENHYREGKLHGKQSSWHQNGQKAVELDYLNGKLSGKQISWHKNGQREGEIDYLDGKKHGKEVRFLGDKNIVIEYRDGVVVKKWTTDKSGNLIK